MKKDNRHFKFYYNRYLDSYRVQNMSASQRGIYCHLFALLAKNKGGVEDNFELHKILKVEKMEDWDVVKKCFYEKDGKLYHTTMDEVIYRNKAYKMLDKGIEERKQKFIADLSAYLDVYDRDMLNDFYRYWSELTKDKKKMLWETKPTWELDLRLQTWKKNNEKYARTTKAGESKQQLAGLKQLALHHLQGNKR